jgi:hypothetical protein
MERYNDPLIDTIIREFLPRLEARFRADDEPDCISTATDIASAAEADRHATASATASAAASATATTIASAASTATAATGAVVSCSVSADSAEAPPHQQGRDDVGSEQQHTDTLGLYLSICCELLYLFKASATVLQSCRCVHLAWLAIVSMCAFSMACNRVDVCI